MINEKDLIEKIEKENPYCDVFTTQHFLLLVEDVTIMEYDGVGYLHDGKSRTDIDVWSVDLDEVDIDKFPYVCWYNR